MPSLYTHYLFGTESIESFPEDLKSVVAEGEQQFLLGLQGPDLFFYGSIFHDEKALAFGSRLHNLPVHKSLEQMLKGFSAEIGNPKGALSSSALAYILGYIGHFTLDSSCHPYVYSVQENEATHLALETDFDNYLLRKKGCKPHKVKLYKICCPADVITILTAEMAYSAYQPEISLECVESCVKDLRFVRRLMRTPTALRFKLVKAGMERAGIYERFYGMMTPPPTKENPLSLRWKEKPDDALQQLEKCFARARELYPEYIRDFMKSLEKGDPWPEAFYKTFE